MKRRVMIGLGTLMVLAMVVATHGAITGSAHDFSTSSWNYSGEICQPCHTPHNAGLDVPDAPLWNRTVTGKRCMDGVV